MCVMNVEKAGINKEKLIYVLRDVENNFDPYIDGVLNDSQEDPHHSAVYTTNLIKCYIELMKQLGEKLSYEDVKSYFWLAGYEEEEYEKFEAWRKKESTYYRGPQY